MQEETIVQIVLKNWNGQVARIDKFLEAADDSKLSKDVAPGRNSGKYILGHLVAVNDSVFSLLGTEKRLYVHYDDPFIKNPDKSGLDTPDLAKLREDWKLSNAALSKYFSQLSNKDWFGRHTAVSEEDFAKDTTRNKLNIVLSRANHMAYHIGQLVLIK